MNEMKDIFPFKRVFNLARLETFWREKRNDESPVIAAHAARIVEELERRPELLEPEISRDVMARHSDFLPVLMTPVIPLGGSGTQYAATMPPYQLDVFYATEAFRELKFEDRYNAEMRVTGVSPGLKEMAVGRAVSAYSFVLERVCGTIPDWVLPFIYSVTDPETGLSRHFKIEFDLRFVDVKIHGEEPKISEEDIDRLRQDLMNLQLWKELLPPEKFELHGFVAVNATEVTIPEELSLLKDDLLRPRAMNTEEDVDNLERRLRTLLRRPELKLGLIAIERSEIGAVEGGRPIGRSLLMSEAGDVPQCPNRSQSYYAKAFDSGEPVIVNDLESCGDLCTGFEYYLIEKGFRNVVIAPLLFEDKLVGILELASPNAGDLNSWNVGKLLQVRNLFATAINREVEQREDRLQAVIKRHYTAIHPSVEWRFRDAAMAYMDARAEGKRAEPESIVFEGVYPLYGLSDIRGSSTHRVASIQADMVDQLELALTIVRAARESKSLPALDELAYQIERNIREIESDLSSGDEVLVLDFLRTEVEGRLDHLASYGPAVAAAVETYRNALNSEIGAVYNKRRAFDNSVALVNERIAEFLEKSEEHAQTMFPHYFERFLTDGVDYNIYIGHSIAPDAGFDPLHLRNLRLWQLMTMCGVVWEMAELQKELPVPLETAHLILVQSSPLSIRFRDDEKQFDVDGAYNARYEIVKKRIDKAVIKETGERLTQPGMIAIVYAQQREGDEYLRYIDYLTAAGYIVGDVEDVQLEDLQGVNGLRALRVRAAATSPDVKFAITPEGEVKPIKVLA